MTDTTWTHPGADYRARLPLSIVDAGLDSCGEPDPTSQDRPQNERGRFGPPLA